MSKIISGARDAKTVAFPNTVREVQCDAFRGMRLRSVVLNEGIEAIWPDAFRESGLKSVTFPASIRKID